MAYSCAIHRESQMKSVLDACLTSKDRLYNILVEHKKVRLGVPVSDKSDTRLDIKNPELRLVLLVSKPSFS